VRRQANRKHGYARVSVVERLSDAQRRVRSMTMKIEEEHSDVNCRRAAIGGRRKRLSALLLAISLFGLLPRYSVLASPGEEPTAPKMRVAVLDLSGSLMRLQTGFVPNFSNGEVVSSQPSDFARGLTEMLTTELVKTGKFVVLERAALQQLTAEQDFAATERVSPETAPARNLITGAQALITGDITEVAPDNSKIGAGFNIAGFNTKIGRTTAKVVLNIRMIDAVTGEVIFSERVKGTSSKTGLSSDAAKQDQALSFEAQSNKPLGRASRKAIELAVAALVSRMDSIPWQGRVVEVRGNDVYINAGAEQGIRVGMGFEVYERQQALIDPDSGRMLGAPERRIGAINIVTVEGKYSIARSTAGESMKRGHVVRPGQHLAKRISE
jgi:curli biogenesis system outer membrane secretion channel CsgG